MPIENKNYKDTVFRMIYRDKLRLLELYNAMNNSNYTNPDDLTITTLEGETFLKMKNDVSFLLDFELNLFEHQSSPCPNIPLRDLEYVASIYRELVPIESTYQAQKIKIPTPRFVVFYNGTIPLNDIVTYKLSDMFVTQSNEPSLELIVTLYNINEGHNKALLEVCKGLRDYSIFVSKVRKYREKYTLEASYSEDLSSKEIVRKAVVQAIDECIKEDILKDFFEAYREEAIEMGVLEYSAERHIQVIKDESYSMGLEDKEKELKPVIDGLSSENKSLSSENESLSKKNASLTGENAYLRKLLEEHGIQP